MRDLTSEEIAKFAGRKGIKKSNEKNAVENFLGTLGEAGSESGERLNACSDAASYRWSEACLGAILAGIKLAYKK
jgi:hypothetical protein